MSELRYDPVTGTWTIFAPERAGRPKEFSRPPDEVRADADACPLCAGMEHATPPSVLELCLPGESAWSVRVVPNLYPALSDDADDGLGEIDAPAPYAGRPGWGMHEVIVETPRHGEGLADYGAAHAELLVEAYAHRIAAWRADGRAAAATLFRNYGRAAGASLSHAHAQLLAMGRVPDALVRELGCFSQHASDGNGCVLCAALAADDAGGRVVFDDGVVAAHCPWAGPIPYYVRIAPRACARSLADADAATRASLAAALRASAGAVRGVFGEVAFNVVVHDAPYAAQRAGLPFHWHVDLILRTSDQAGLEWGTATFINQVDPDRAAAELRAARG